MPKDDLLAIHEAASLCSRGDAVEIGCYRGRTTIALSHAFMDKPGQYVWTIDPHDHSIGVHGGQYGPEDHMHYYRSMIEASGYLNVRHICLPSIRAALGFSREIGFLVLDGDHQYESVCDDWSSWEKFLLPNAMVVLDDCWNSESGPERLFCQLENKGQLCLKHKSNKLKIASYCGSSV